MQKPRLYWLDYLRFFLIVSMIVYHFYWDLLFFHFIQVSYATDILWRYFAHFTAAGFLILSGFSVGLSYKTHNKQTFKKHFIIRLLKIGLAAASISIVTYLLFPQDFIYFGILHQIAFSSLFLLLLLPRNIYLNIFIALFIFRAKFYIALSFGWIGFGPPARSSLDFVPIFPWTGFMILGSILAKIYIMKTHKTIYRKQPKFIVFCSRHSLLIYLLHQPVLFGMVFLAHHYAPHSIEKFNKPAFISSCIKQCRNLPYCQAYCQCMSKRMTDNNFKEAINVCKNKKAG